jgi:hypothetical protein
VKYCTVKFFVLFCPWILLFEVFTFMLMQDEVKRVKLVGIEPKKYFSKKQQRDVTGFNMYFDQESEHVYGLAVKEEWVSNEVYADFISLFDGDPHKALGEQVEVFYNRYRSVTKIVPCS